MAKKRLFNNTRMTLTRVDDGGNSEEPKAYLHLESALSAEDYLRLGLQELRESDIVDVDGEDRIPVDVGALGYGEGFAVTLTTAPDNEDQGELFEPDDIVPDVVAEKIVKASIRKSKLKQSILIPLANGEAFWPLRDYSKDDVMVTIIQGRIPPKQIELGGK